MKKSRNKEDVGEQLSELGHEFNNLLTTILANLRFARQEDLSYTARKHVDRAAEFTVRAADLAYYLLALSQKQNLVLRVVEPNEVVKNLELRLKKYLGKSRGIKILPSLIRHRIYVDPIEFEKTLIALCINSCEAMPKYGEISIRIARHEVDGAQPGEKNYKKGDYVLIEISDNGVGMSEAVRKKACDPFFTTKKDVKGAGMGLSMVSDFLKQSGGYIRIDSVYNKGTTVRILLPRYLSVSEKQAGAARKRATKEREGSGETILLVEDDINVLRVVGQGLKAKNYDVLLAGDGQKAIDTILAEKHIDLLVTDVFLVDDISGREVAQQFHKSFPKSGIIFCSGYHEDVVRKKLSLGKESEVISKPYELRTLLMKMSQRLKEVKQK